MTSDSIHLCSYSSKVAKLGHSFCLCCHCILAGGKLTADVPPPGCSFSLAALLKSSAHFVEHNNWAANAKFYDWNKANALFFVSFQVTLQCSNPLLTFQKTYLPVGFQTASKIIFTLLHVVTNLWLTYQLVILMAWKIVTKEMQCAHRQQTHNRDA